MLAKSKKSLGRFFSLCKFSKFTLSILLIIFSGCYNIISSNHVITFSSRPPFQITRTFTVAGNHTFTVPNGVTSITVEVWGGGGRGGSRTSGTNGSGGGGGGAYSRETISVTPGESFVIEVGAGSSSSSVNGEPSWVSVSDQASAFVLAAGGMTVPTNSTSGGAGGSAAFGIGTTRFSGGNGASALNITTSGGGGSSGGYNLQGTNASNNLGGIAPAGGGNGGNGRTSAGSGSAGAVPGGGGGGAVRGSSGSPSGGNGAKGQVSITYTYAVDAGSDVTTCQNSLFTLSTPTPPTGFTADWQIISGNGNIYNSSANTTSIHIPEGSSATVRLTVSDGVTSVTDDVTLTNSGNCNSVCENSMHVNGDLELAGSAILNNLSFQGTNATLIQSNSNPVYISSEYRGNTPNTASFTGAYYLNKTAAQSDPHSGSKMIYLAGNGFGISAFESDEFYQCGRSYRISAWVAAYTNAASQQNTNYQVSFLANGNSVSPYQVLHNIVAPASVSWNNVNWQKISFEVTIPSNGYEWSKVIFRTLNNTQGILIDDICIEEIFQGAFADAGSDILNCSNDFYMSANNPDPGYSGVWSALNGNVNISDASSHSSNVTINNNDVAHLRWTVTDNSGPRNIMLIDPDKDGGFENGSTFSSNGWTAVNATFNIWNLGDIASPTSGQRSAYISYYNNANYGYYRGIDQTVHIYKDVIFHPDADDIELSFKWKGVGEAGHDRLLVYTAPVAVTPSTGVPSSPLITLSGATLVSSLDLHSSPNYQTTTINLPNSLAGTNSRLIFTWQNDDSDGTLPPASIDEISLTHTVPACSGFDDVVIGYVPTDLIILNDTICTGDEAELSVSECDNGSVLWSTSETSDTIRVSPLVTTSYSVTCTPDLPANLLLNPGYESATDLQFWTVQGISPVITSLPSEVRSGLKAVKIDGTNGMSRITQFADVLPGEKYVLKAWAKTTTTNKNPKISYTVFTSGYTQELISGNSQRIAGSDFEEYTLEFIIPPNGAHISVFAETENGVLFVDDWGIYKYTSCIATVQGTVVVNPLPAAPVVGTITHPTCIVPSGSVLLTGLPETGDWVITRFPGAITYSGNGTSYLISGLAPDSNYTFTVTNQNSCVSQISQEVIIYPIPEDPVLSGSDYTCDGRTLNIFPESGGTWSSSNPAIANIDNNAFISANSPGSVTFTFVRSSDGCTSSKQFTVRGNPFAPFVGSITQPTCTNPFGSVELSNLPNFLTWKVKRSFDDYTYFGSGTGLSADSLQPNQIYDFIVEDFYGCFSPPSAAVIINPLPTNPVLGGSDYVCLGNNTFLTPSTNGSWTSSDTSIIKINNSGLVQGLSTGTGQLTYQRAADGCISVIDFDVLPNPPAPVFGDIIHPTCTVPSGSVSLLNLPETGMYTIVVFPDSLVLSGSGNSFMVTGLHPDSSYSFKVIDTFGCSSLISDSVYILPIPSDPVISGDTGVCKTISAQVFPSGAGVWISGNVSLATVNNNGVVTGILPGIVELTYTRDVDGCDQTVLFEIWPNPVSPSVGIITQPTCIIPSGSVVMSDLPSSGDWTLISNPAGINYSGSGTVDTIISLNPNTTYTFIVKDSNQCYSAPSANVVVLPIPNNPFLGGDTLVCESGTAQVTPVSGGVWSTQNSSIAEIQNNGLLTGISPGNVVVTYIRNSDGCQSEKNIIVQPRPFIPAINNIIQPTCIHPFGKVELNGLPDEGDWIITVEPGNIIFNGTGSDYILNSLPPGNNYSLFVTDYFGCNSLQTIPVAIKDIPADPVITGDSLVCIGASVQLSPSSGGQWVSNNTSVAVILPTGLVTSLAASEVVLTYTRDDDGCSSDFTLTVLPLPAAPAVSTIIQPTCTIPTGSVLLIDLPSSGDWTIIRLPGNISYTGNGTEFLITDLPPDEIYTFYLKNQYNCLSVSSANVDINPIPADPVITGTFTSCEGSSVPVFPVSGGVWISSNTSVAQINNSGMVDALFPGTSTLTFTRTSDGCFSSVIFEVFENPVVQLTAMETCQDKILTIQTSTLAGLLPFTYSWTGPNGYTSADSIIIRQNADLSMSGLYFVTISDANGCIYNGGISMVIHQNPSFTAVIQDVSTFNGLDGIINITVSGGSPTYNYLWSNGAVTEDLINVSHGLYQVTVTDINGCTAFNETEYSVGHPADCSGYRTHTQSGWGEGAFGNNAGTYRDENFDAAFPDGLTIGCDNKLILTTALAVDVFLPSFGVDAILPPGTMIDSEENNNNFAAQLVALTLSYEFDLYDNDFSASTEPLGELRIGSGPLLGMTVENLLIEANYLIGGCPSAYSIADIVNALTLANENYVDGKVTGDFLVCCQMIVNTFGGTICSGDSIDISSEGTNGRWPYSYEWSDGLGADSIKIVSPLSTYTYIVTVTDLLGCTASADLIVNVNPSPVTNIFAPAICEGNFLTLTAFVSSGTPGFTYSWTGPQGFTSTVSPVSLINANQSMVGLYYVTVTDQNGCTGTSSKMSTVYIKPNTPIIDSVYQPLCIPPTGSVSLSDLPPSGIWEITVFPGKQTINGSGTTAIVNDLLPDQEYTFIVMDDYSCQSEISLSASVGSIPQDPEVGGTVETCIGTFTYMTPSELGIWTSSNPSVASIDNNGFVNALNAGTTILTYQRTVDGCSNTLFYTVNSKPIPPVIGVVTQPTCTTPTGSVEMTNLPENENWTIIRYPGAIPYYGMDNSFTINGLPINRKYKFTVLNSNYCISDTSADVIINEMPINPVLSGDNAVCLGDSSQLLPATGGFWYSGMPGVADVDSIGMVKSISPGNTILTYIRDSDGCNNSIPFTVYSNPLKPIVSNVVQPTCVIPTGSVTISSLPVSGNWNITVMPGNINFTGSEESFNISGLQPDETYTFFVRDNNNCLSAISDSVVIFDIPSDPVLDGVSSLCIGNTSQLSPSTGGIWSTSNATIAGITSDGLVTGYGSGLATLRFIRNSDGCFSEKFITINSNPSVPFVNIPIQPTCYNPVGSVLLQNLPSSGNWSIIRSPEGIVYTGSGNSFLIPDLPIMQAYSFRVSNQSGCISLPSAQILIGNIPSDPVISGDTSLCVGTITTITPENHGVWSSSDTNVATVTNQGVVSGISSGSVLLTFTRTADGCAQSCIFNVLANPDAPLISNIAQPTCYDQTGSVRLDGLPSSGSWILERMPGSVSYSGSGSVYNVMGLPVQQSYFFKITDENGCISVQSDEILIQNIPDDPEITGDNQVCVGTYASVSSSDEGVWTTANGSIATINEEGNIYGVATGIVTIGFTRTIDGCNTEKAFTVYPNPGTLFIGQVVQPTCITPSGSVLLTGLPAGNWTVSSSPPGNDYSGSTSDLIVNNLAVGSIISFFSTNEFGCSSGLSANVIINEIPSDPVLSGDSTVCIDNVINVLPFSGGTWTTDNQSVSTVSSTGMVTGISVGIVTLTFVRTTDGCSSTKQIQVYPNPENPAIGLITHPDCIQRTGSVVLNNLPATGPWIITRYPENVTYSGSGSSYTIQGLAPDNNYYFSVENSNHCFSDTTEHIYIAPIPADPVVTGNDMVCLGGSSQLFPSTGGSWVSSEPYMIDVTNEGFVSTIEAGSAVLTYTRSSDGCSASMNFYSNPNPVADIQGSSIVCSGGLGFLEARGGVIFEWSTGSVNPTIFITNSGTYYVTVTNSFGCTSSAEQIVTISSGLSVDIDYDGSVCFKPGKELSALVSRGIPPYTYFWTGPSGMTSNAPSIVIANNGNYFVTVTDAAGCTAESAGFVFQNYDPFIVALNTTVCEGHNVMLDVESPSAVSYLWSANAGNATTKSVIVNPEIPSSLYSVTVTNEIGCTAVPSVLIGVIPKPQLVLAESNSICQGETTSLIPSVQGFWQNLNPGVAVINSQGIVTGISEGSARFLFTSLNGNCLSDTSETINVYNIPLVTMTDPGQICIGHHLQLQPSSGGTWTSTNPLVAGINNSGLVTGLSSGISRFLFTNSATGCTSFPSPEVLVESISNTVLSGPEQVCVGSNILLGADLQGGTWQTSNPSVATVNTSGIVTGLAPGTVEIVYTLTLGSCVESTSKTVSVIPKPIISFGSLTSVCEGETSILLPSSGGIWTSSNNSVAAINNSGHVTAVQAGTTTFRFLETSTGCYSDYSQNFTVKPLPIISLSGLSQICVGNNTNVLPASGGTWVSSNPSAASISDEGLITGISSGSVEITFTNNSTGCSSVLSDSIDVFGNPSLQINYHGSNCLQDSSQLSVIITGGSPEFVYSWSGPNDFEANTENIFIEENGNYDVTITDNNGCSATVSGFIHEVFEPIVSYSESVVCEEDSVSLEVQANQAVSYLWSSNAQNSTDNEVVVVPVFPVSTYYVTVTNVTGCSVIAEATISVNSKPVIQFSGSESVCVGELSNISPVTGGIWSSINPAVATVSNAGLITGIQPGFTRFLYTNSTTLCVSDTSDIFEVRPKTSILNNGPYEICEDGQLQLEPSGIGWTSGNPLIASADNNGLVTSFSGGIAIFSYTNYEGCTSDETVSITVHSKPDIVLNGNQFICLDGNTQYLPSTGGLWTSLNPGVATIINNGEISAVSEGQARFLFTDLIHGCVSDTSQIIYVLDSIAIELTGGSEICTGETTSLLPSSGGLWISNNPTIASISSGGIVTGLQPGTATFTFISNSVDCFSGSSLPITVHARPIVAFTGPTQLCIGDSTSVIPSTSGTWASSNPSVAQILNNGTIYAIGSGVSDFVFTQSSTGCSSVPTSEVSVLSIPNVALTGPTTICEDGFTSLSPSTGGVWYSSDSDVATVNSTGIVTGHEEGVVYFMFMENGSGCVSLPTENVSVISYPTVSLTGPQQICINSTTQLNPVTGGSWVSLQPSVATVTNTGLVTGRGPGMARFVFTNQTGCVSEPTEFITVHAKPITTITGQSQICINGSTQILPSSGGIWVSSRPHVLSISNTGVISGISSGNARFVYTDTITGCQSDSSQIVNVFTNPEVRLSGSGSICVGQNTLLHPTTGGQWISLNPSIAAVNSNGTVNGLSAGFAGFRFTEISTGCSSELHNIVQVKARPEVSLAGPGAICGGSTTNLLPSSGGTWSSLDPAIAMANNSGLVTGLNIGNARFRFTELSSGCSSSQNIQVTVISDPTIVLDGPDKICIGGHTQLLPNEGGIWESTNPSVITVTNDGLVTGVGYGVAQCRFLHLVSGCYSNLSVPIEVTQTASFTLDGSADICVGYCTKLNSNQEGIWFSRDINKAVITSDGKITGIAPGKANFYFIESASGCMSDFTTDLININNCINPDFNVTSVNIPVSGNLNTNDQIQSGSFYISNPIFISKPEGSSYNLTISNNGNYIFTGNTPGKYRFNVKVCTPDMSVNCPQFPFTITVVEPKKMEHCIVANIDLATTYINTPVLVSVLDNDHCINSTTCSIDSSLVTLHAQGNSGTALFNTNKKLQYNPQSGFIGSDTIMYKICASNDGLNCVFSRVIIIVKDSTADNSISASDDFYYTDKNTALEGLPVKANDMDPESENIFVTPQGSIGSPVIIPNGSYYILNNGNLYFTPAPNFVGPLDISYELCDDNGNCAKATAHILVLDNLRIRVSVYLEGALINNGGMVGPENRPLMRDDLRTSTFTNRNEIPVFDPYSYPMPLLDLTSIYEHVGKGGNQEYRQISDSSAVFSVNGPDAIVDWVFVELRNIADSTEILATRSGLIQRDGNIVDLDGVSALEFPGIRFDSCYIVVRHRSHLGVMSEKVSTLVDLDFRNINTPVFDFGNRLQNGFNYTGLALKIDEVTQQRCMWAGDADGNGVLKFVNPNDDQNMMFFEVISFPENEGFYANYNYGFGYMQGDFDMNGKVKYDNPNDDKNYLFYQILFYPLNVEYISNFNAIIEQVPPSK